MMMAQIRAMPTEIKPPPLGEEMPVAWHESMTRSYHIVDYVKWLLDEDTPSVVILAIIDDLREARPA